MKTKLSFFFRSKKQTWEWKSRNGMNKVKWASYTIQIHLWDLLYFLDPQDDDIFSLTHTLTCKHNHTNGINYQTTCFFSCWCSCHCYPSVSSCTAPPGCQNGPHPTAWNALLFWPGKQQSKYSDEVWWSDTKETHSCLKKIFKKKKD